jgi:hypothetical protein
MDCLTTLTNYHFYKNKGNVVIIPPSSTPTMTSFSELYYFNARQIAYSDVSYSFLSVSVDANKSKMLMATDTGDLFYATSSNGGFFGGSYVSGGGGGAGQIGGNATSTTVPGVGGNGIGINITGTLSYYGAGGGGAGLNVTSLGGLGGGGAGGNPGGTGTANTGSGGGAGRTSYNPGSGGSGIVIISVPTQQLGTYTGTTSVTINGSYTVISFLSNGTYTN